MIGKDNIKSLVGNHVAPYIYNSNHFEPGKTPIYYSGPYWDNKEIEAAIDTLLNGKWITSGEKVFLFEKYFSNKFNVKHSFMVNSGSSANLTMIAALKKRFGWDDDDEIIVSPVGFATTISVLYQNRLKPVFVDIEWETLNFDVNKIEEKITSKTKGIFVSPVLGNPPDMDKIIEICEKHNLKLIGDNCDSLGTKWDGKFLNENYIAFSNSFYPAHHISTGEGGMVCTNDEELKKLIMSIAWWGRDCYCVGSSNLLSCGTCGKRFSNWLDSYDGVVFQGNIDVKSFCSHHHLPFIGYAHVAYIPSPDGKVIGLSKLNRIVEYFARRPQVQENLLKNLTQQVFYSAKCRRITRLTTRQSD
jgi:CDP-6-deoxy-D-xylo-4-hexulose-3-dehydrase